MSPSPKYVVVWRDTPSPQARLRTYTNASTDAPTCFALDELRPSPDTILSTTDEVTEYLTSHSTDPVAIPCALAESVLGWSPAPSPSSSPTPSTS